MLNWWRLPLNTVSSLSCRSDLTVLTLQLINQTTSLSSSSRTKLTDYFYLEPDNSSAGSFCSTVSLFAGGNTKSTHWVNRGDSKNGSVSFILYVMFVSHIYFIFNMNKWVIHNKKLPALFVFSDVFYWKLGELIEIYKRQLQKVYHIFNLPTFYLFIVCDYLEVEIWIAS